MMSKAISLCAIFLLGTTLPAADSGGVSRTAPLDGTKVHFTEYGSGEHALVFVHGWACDETFWSGQAPALGAKYHVITIDLPGHGQSDKSPAPYTMDLFARAIDAVLGEAKVKTATLVGHSNGTPVIRQFYRKYPAKTRALVIVDGGLRPFGTRETMEKFIAGMKGPNYAENIGQLIDNMTSPIQDAAMRARIKRTMLQTPQDVAIPEFEATLDEALWKPDKINVPVLMVLAKQPIWSAEYKEFASSVVPDLDYQVWENVSHFLMLEKPEEFNRALVAFVEKHQLAKN